MNKQLLIKALCSHRKAKLESLKNNEKNGRTNLVEVRKQEIETINKAIESLECSIFNFVW
jgi:demethoxyubiquinone hydroxylase (CLK1/Coq7/Cat5 family)